jgi:hypothetical protein
MHVLRIELALVAAAGKVSVTQGGDKKKSEESSPAKVSSWHCIGGLPIVQ